MPIQTKRLTLRLYSHQDYELLRELDSDARVLRYRSRKTITSEMTQNFLDEALKAHKVLPRKHFSYAITLSENKEWLGQCGMTMVSQERQAEKRAYLWYSLLPKYWGQGYMTEAIRALIYVGFFRFGLEAIEAECEIENTGSVRVMKKSGLEYKGLIEREASLGRIKQRFHYEIKKEDWKPSRPEEPKTIGLY